MLAMVVAGSGISLVSEMAWNQRAGRKCVSGSLETARRPAGTRGRSRHFPAEKIRVVCAIANDTGSTAEGLCNSCVSNFPNPMKAAEAGR